MKIRHHICYTKKINNNKALNEKKYNLISCFDSESDLANHDRETGPFKYQ